MLATAKLNSKPRSVSVKQKSSYWQLIHQAMLGESCFPVAQKDGYYTYQYRTLPEGYQMNCTKAMELLQRAWWSRNSRNHRLGFPMDLLILNRGTWYPIRELDLHP